MSATETETEAEQLSPELAVQVRRAMEVCARAARGDLEARITGIGDPHSDLGRMFRSINHVLDIADAYVRESSAAMEYCAKGKFFRPIVLRGLPGAYAKAASVINAAADKMGESHGQIQNMHKERHRLADEFERQVMGSVNQVASASAELEATARQMTDGAQESSRLATAVRGITEDSSGLVAEASRACEQCIEATDSISDQAQATGRLTAKAVEASDAAGSVVKTMASVSKQIESVVEFIGEIASQTNLLALNASIEAARAGEAGLGFAVVATEVRKLSENTAKATNDIRRQVGAIQQASDESLDAIQVISTVIGDIDSNSGSITKAVTQQKGLTDVLGTSVSEVASGTRNIVAFLDEASEAAQETGSGASELQAAAGDLSRLAESLADHVDTFLMAVRND